MKRAEYQVRPILEEIRQERQIGKHRELEIKVPGSKSITNRALLLAALAEGDSTLTGVLFSDDSRHLMQGLKDLGFSVEIEEEKKTVRMHGLGGRMPKLPEGVERGKVYVGSAGTAARFMTAMLACAGGAYELDASEQMRKRPMKPLLDALAGLGVRVTYLGEEGFFPFVLESEGIRGGEVSIDVGISSQFLSSLLMAGTMLPEGLRIRLTGQRKSLPYVEMTARLMERYGVSIKREEDVWIVPGRESLENSVYRAGEYAIEPDVSGACYFYAMALLLGISVRVQGVHEDSLQGDKKFLQVLAQLGCQVDETPEGIRVIGPEDEKYPGIRINMNDFSDQTMTMAVVAAFAQSVTRIEGVGHIRHQESNRIRAIQKELERLGIRCKEYEDGLEIRPKKIRAGRVRTYEDHRMAMAFSLIGLRVSGIVIEDPDCCAKTFENYFDLLDEITGKKDEGDVTSENVTEEDKKSKKREGTNKTTDVENKKGSIPGLFLFFLGSLFYLEMVFHIGHFGLPTGDFLYSCLFLLSLAGGFGFFASFGRRGMRMTISYLLQVCMSLLYAIQQVYCHVFQTYLTTFSLTTGTGQIMGYWRETLLAIWQSVPWLLLYLLPIGLLGVYWWWEGRCREKKQGEPSSDPQGKLKTMAWRSALLAIAVSVHVGTVAGLPLFGTEYYTAYDLYHHTSAIDISMRRLGVWTTMRLDVKRMIFGMPEPPLYSMEDEWTEDWEDAWSEDPEADENVVVEADDEIDNEMSGEPDGTDSADSSTDESGVDENDVEDTDEENDPVVQSPKGSNTLPIDFDALIESAPNSTVADMHRYFKTSGVTQKNAYTGMFEGYNLIMLTAEGFSPYAVDENVTPTLYKLTQEGFIFNNFYTPLWGVSTTDGEYVACTGLIPKAGVWSFYRTAENAMPFGFGNQFARLGYRCYAYHNHTFDYYRRDVTHPNMGYDYKGVGNGLQVKETWPESDLEMMEVTIPEYIGEEPFHVYYMTVSGHLNYSFVGNTMSNKNRDLVADLPYSDAGKAYIACNIELDRALEKLLAELEAAGIADRTVIALSADHYPYGLEKEALDELAGHEVEENFEIYRNHFFVWSAGMEEPIVVDKVACSMDIVPTLSNLFGLDYDARLFMGRDVLSEQHKGLVIFSNRSFITDKVMFNGVTGEVTLLTEEELPADYIQRMNHIVNQKFQYSAKIIEQDYYQYFTSYLEQSPESE